MDYSLTSSSVHGILQARILEWVAISLSRRSSQLKDQTQVSCIAGRFFTIYDTREAVTHMKGCMAQGEHFTWAGRGLAWCYFLNMLIHICGMALQSPMAMEGDYNCSFASLSFFFLFLLRTPLVIGMAILKCRQKQRFKKVLGGWEKNKFLEERAA